MKETALRLLEDLETQLKEIELAKIETIERVEDSIRKTISVLETLKTNFVKYKFESKKNIGCRHNKIFRPCTAIKPRVFR